MRIFLLKMRLGNLIDWSNCLLAIQIVSHTAIIHTYDYIYYIVTDNPYNRQIFIVTAELSLSKYIAKYCDKIVRLSVYWPVKLVQGLIFLAAVWSAVPAFTPPRLQWHCDILYSNSFTKRNGQTFGKCRIIQTALDRCTGHGMSAYRRIDCQIQRYFAKA